MGKNCRRSWSRRDSVDQHGCRWNEARLRSRFNTPDIRIGPDPGHRIRRCRKSATFIRRINRRCCKCSAGCKYLSLPGSHDRSSQVVFARSRSRHPMNDIIEKAKFGADGLIPAIVQDARTREVLTLAYMNKESLQLTIEKKETWFWSRSRQQLWHKGETSGHSQKVTKLSLDCDSDAVLVEVEPLGPACHTGAYSCFGVEPELEGVLQELYSVIEQRKEKRPDGSYTTYLFNSGLDKILKKVGEEATETIVAAKNSDSQRLVSETSDLLYHLLVLLVERGVTLDEITRELKERRK